MDKVHVHVDRHTTIFIVKNLSSTKVQDILKFHQAWVEGAKHRIAF